MLLGEPNMVLPDFVKSENIGGIIADFTPLRKPVKWLNDVIAKLPKNVPVCQVGLWKSLLLFLNAVSYLTWLHYPRFYLLTDVQGCNNYFILCLCVCQILIKINVTKRALIYKSKHIIPKYEHIVGVSELFLMFGLGLLFLSAWWSESERPLMSVFLVIIWFQSWVKV